ncbi:hypothetical protein LSAT2_002954 [Lamellibrachia satsuma]|nr:hypothetical protein LSAT2_002954 [Lamellibrachia satsuma]
MNSMFTGIILVTIGMVCFTDAWLLPIPELTCALECDKNYQECIALCDAKKLQGVDRSHCLDEICRAKRNLCMEDC